MLLYVPSGGEMGSGNTGLYGAESFIGNEKKEEKLRKLLRTLSQFGVAQPAKKCLILFD